MQTEKSHAWSAVHKLENQGSQWCDSLSLRASEPGAPMSRKEKMNVQHKKTEDPPFFHLSVLFSLPVVWMMPTHTAEGNLL